MDDWLILNGWYWVIDIGCWMILDDWYWVIGWYWMIWISLLWYATLWDEWLLWIIYCDNEVDYLFCCGSSVYLIMMIINCDLWVIYLCIYRWLNCFKQQLGPKRHVLDFDETGIGFPYLGSENHIDPN